MKGDVNLRVPLGDERSVYVPVTSHKPRGCNEGTVGRGHHHRSEGGGAYVFQFGGSGGPSSNEASPEILRA